MSIEDRLLDIRGEEGEVGERAEVGIEHGLGIAPGGRAACRLDAGFMQNLMPPAQSGDQGSVRTPTRRGACVFQPCPSATGLQPDGDGPAGEIIVIGRRQRRRRHASDRGDVGAN